MRGLKAFSLAALLGLFVFSCPGSNQVAVAQGQQEKNTTPTFCCTDANLITRYTFVQQEKNTTMTFCCIEGAERRFVGKCTEANLLDALQRARRWLPKDELIGQPVSTVTPTFVTERSAGERLREQADDLDQIDKVLK